MSLLEMLLIGFIVGMFFEKLCRLVSDKMDYNEHKGLEQYDSLFVPPVPSFVERHGRGPRISEMKTSSLQKQRVFEMTKDDGIEESEFMSRVNKGKPRVSNKNGVVIPVEFGNKNRDR